MTKKRLRLTVAAGIAALTLAASSVSALATVRNYSFAFPKDAYGSMRSTSLYSSSAGTRPYVKPSISTVKTHYFLSPQRLSSMDATNEVVTTSTSIGYFSYKSGYLAGENYCLSGYPDILITHDPYNARGVWNQ